MHKEGRYHFWPRRLLTRSFYHFWPRPLLAQTALWPFPACAKVGPRRVGPRRVRPRRVAPEISRFFPSPATIFFLSSLSWRSFRGILTAVQGRGPPKVRVWVLWGHFVRAPTAHKLVNERSGFHKMTPGTPNAHFGWTSALDRDHNSTRGPPRDSRENEIFGGRGNKRAKFRGRAEGRVLRRAGAAEGWTKMLNTPK